MGDITITSDISRYIKISKPIAYDQIINALSHPTPLTYFSMGTLKCPNKIKNKTFLVDWKNINLDEINFQRTAKS